MPEDLLTRFAARDDLRRALELHVEAAAEFHRLAQDLSGDALPVGPLDPASFAPERNVFSALFLTVTRALVGDSPHLPLYAMVNQCMRAWVTACDNLLDDEYKPALPFAFDAAGPRMRSALTLMVADRVLAEFAAERFPSDGIAALVGRRTLSALASSALQECEEEHTSGETLRPERVLDDIHERKTGDLFTAPLALPVEIDRPDAARARAAGTALRQFGLACQVLDDVQDMAVDLARGKQNLLVSMGHHGGNALRRRLADSRADAPAWSTSERFPELVDRAWPLAHGCFDRSFHALDALGIPFDSSERDALVRLIAKLLRVSLPAAAHAGRPAE